MGKPYGLPVRSSFAARLGMPQVHAAPGRARLDAAAPIREHWGRFGGYDDGMAVLVNPSGEVLAELGGVMTGKRGPYFMPGYTGPMSIKTMIRGQGIWRTGDARFLVEPGQVLILEHGQRYTLTIEASQEVETFCPFFAPRLVREAARARRVSQRALLDRPTDEDAAIPGFIERLRRPGPAVCAALDRLRQSLHGDDDESPLLDLLDAVMDEVDRDRATIEQVPATRPATREQLFRQIHRAVEYAHANVAGDLSVSALARVAGMSTYHFHRTFCSITGQTPARYVSALRLDRARTLLTSSSRSVTEVCAEVGLASLGSFSAGFRRRFGTSPSSLRRD